VVSLVTSPSRRRGRLRTVSKTTVSDAQSSGEVTDPLRVPGFRPHHRKQTGSTGVPGQEGGRPERAPPVLARPSPEIHPTIHACKVPTPSRGWMLGHPVLFDSPDRLGAPVARRWWAQNRRQDSVS
jgi:hypothetical protein